MAIERFEGALNAEDFTDIAEYLGQTPESFYSAKPILYYSCFSASLVISLADLGVAPLLSSYADISIPDGSTTEGDSREITIAGVDIWVTSEDLKLYFPSHHGGITIPYPAISLHAIQPPASPTSPSSVYLQILKEIRSYDDHDPESTISVTLIPANSTPEHDSPVAESDASLSTPHEVPISSTNRLFAALTDCANLHPDPTSDSDFDSEAGGPTIAYEGDGHFFSTMNGQSSGTALPPPMPGSGGWITAENIGDFYDEDGNPRDPDDLPAYMARIAGAGATLGNGAGSVRARDEDGDVTDEDIKLNGDETKWRRTE